MSMLHKVMSLAELRASGAAGAEIAGRRIALFAAEGEVFATTGECPHAGGPLCEGELDGAMLSCPWHGWTYDLRSGACEEDPDLRLERFEVRIIDGDIFVVI
jgi:nitrite reductase (NADH) small subunit